MRTRRHFPATARRVISFHYTRGRYSPILSGKVIVPALHHHPEPGVAPRGWWKAPERALSQQENMEEALVLSKGLRR